MKRIVRVTVRDYPKRSDSFRTEVEVDAESDDEALKLGAEAARAKYPTGKVVAYDVARAPQREVLKAKTKAA